jgi:hypothetical protein
MQRSTAGKMLNIAHFQHIGQAAGFVGVGSGFLTVNYEQNEHL